MRQDGIRGQMWHVSLVSTGGLPPHHDRRVMTQANWFGR
jgi:hypothetical protein